MIKWYGQQRRYGALAQLGAHNTGSVGVRGSNPLRSTKYRKGSRRLPFLYFDGRLTNDEPCEFQSLL